MKALLLPIACACVLSAAAQAPGNFQVVIDPPGDNAYHTIEGGLVTPDSAIYVLGGYQNVQEPAFTLGRYNSSGDLLWSRKVTYTGAGMLRPAKVVRVSTGDLFVFGILSGMTGHDYFVTRMSAGGDVQWTRTYHQDIEGSDYGYSSIVATSDDQLVVSMGFINRTVAMRLDLNGDLLWARRYVTDLTPTDKNPGFDFTATADGGVLLTEKAQEDIFLVRLGPDGDVQWAIRYPNDGYCQTRTAILLEDGGFVIAGQRETQPFAARLTPSGEIIWLKEYSFDEGLVDLLDRVVELSDGDLLLTPSSTSTGIMALRVSPLGMPVAAWSMTDNGRASVIGRRNGLVVLSGRAFIEVDGGFEDALLLLGTGEWPDLECVQGNTGATATDIPQLPPVYGYDVLEEAILEGTADMNVSAPLFGTRPLCNTAIGMADAAAQPHLRPYPSPATRGTTVVIDHAGAATIECFSTDGRSLLKLGVPPDGARLELRTDALPAGLYLLVARDGRGAPISRSHLVIQ